MWKVTPSCFPVDEHVGALVITDYFITALAASPDQIVFRNVHFWDFPWWSSCYDSELSVQEARVQALVREPDPTCCN